MFSKLVTLGFCILSLSLVSCSSLNKQPYPDPIDVHRMDGQSLRF